MTAPYLNRTEEEVLRDKLANVRTMATNASQMFEFAKQLGESLGVMEPGDLELFGSFIGTLNLIVEEIDK